MRNFVIVAAGLPSSNGFVYDFKIAYLFDLWYAGRSKAGVGALRIGICKAQGHCSSLLT
jgi:hypothetical protein